MATNFEFYKDEIMKRLKEGEFKTCSLMDVLAIVVNEDAKTLCNKKCAGRSCAECYIELFEILMQEHSEAPKLTKRERAFCELMQEGYIARDKGGSPIWFRILPQKSKEQSMWVVNSYLFNETLTLPRYMNVFTFIKWEDEKPWSVADLMKLEVEA